MARGKRRGRHKGGDSSSDSDQDEASSSPHFSASPHDKNSRLDFKQRRELQRKASADKRRAKQKCHLCGKAGHVRRECPGIDDGGRGESKYKTKGDAGAAWMKGSRKPSGKKGGKNRGRRNRSDVGGDSGRDLALPPGFAPAETPPPENGDSDADSGGEEDDGTAGDARPFRFYDAGCDASATIEYLQSGRGTGAGQTENEAVAEYRRSIVDAFATSNYGGCIARSLVEPGTTWRPEDDPAMEALIEANPEGVWFVLGLGTTSPIGGGDADADSEDDRNAKALAEAVRSDPRAVGVFADLDYAPETLTRRGREKESQLRRMRTAASAAIAVGVPIQIRTSPGGSASSTTADSDAAVGEEGEDDGDSSASDPYLSVTRDLARFLLETTERSPSVRVHLSCYNGKSDHLLHLLNTFPDTAFVGLDGATTFGKATHLHECAFDVPLDRLLLETGSPSVIPSKVTKSLGRDAFCHSGLIPFVAEAVAERKSGAGGKGGPSKVSADEVARAAADNTVKLYGLGGNDDDDNKEEHDRPDDGE